MRVTVCQLNDDRELFERDWQNLAQHVHEQKSELVLLPEMPFSTWFATSKEMNPTIWADAVAAHEIWLTRLGELGADHVLGSRPINRPEQLTGFGGMSGFASGVSSSLRLNQGFIWNRVDGPKPAHAKCYRPDQEGFWEASWYQRGNGEFSLIQAGQAKVGFMICSEMWFMQHSRQYGRDGAQIIATPRCTKLSTQENWLVGGRATAIVAGAYSLSSNRINSETSNPAYGGQGWILAPNGEILGLTSRQQPFITADIDLVAADHAKKTYPRYIDDITF